MVSLKKETKMYEVTPVHLIDEESASPQIVSPVTQTQSITCNTQKNESKLGEFGTMQTIVNNRNEIRTKIKQAKVFTLKRDLKIKYGGSFLEAGNKIIFSIDEMNFGIGQYNLTQVRIYVMSLLLARRFYTEFELKDFDKIFEPDYTLSALYSSNPIIRLFKRKKINEYLQSSKDTIIHNNSNESRKIV